MKSFSRFAENDKNYIAQKKYSDRFFEGKGGLFLCEFLYRKEGFFKNSCDKKGDSH